MFHFLSKLLTLFLMPFFWLFFCIVWAAITKSDKRRKKLIKVVFGIIFIFGNTILASIVMRRWEPKPLEISKLATYDVAIVLGGGIANEFKWPNDRAHFDPSADRLLQAFQLYKMGKVKKILISAGSLSLNSKNKLKTEANISQKFLLLAGVDSAAIIIENESKNTYQNALFTNKVLISKGLANSKLLLITSAYHMKRSQMCFEKQGLKVDIFPSTYQQTGFDFYSFESIIPDEVAFGIWYDLFHEWYGIIIYKLMGYI